MLWLSKGMNWLSLNKTNWNAWKMSCYIKASIIFLHYIRSPEHEQNKMNETSSYSSFLKLLHLIPKKTLEKKYLHWVCVIEVNVFNIEFLFEITVDRSNECYFCGLYALRVFPWIGSLIHFRAAMVFQFMSCFGFSIIDNVSCWWEFNICFCFVIHFYDFAWIANRPHVISLVLRCMRDAICAYVCDF